MKLTKSKLKQIIKEELTFLGALETELNFARKHGLLENEDEDDTYEEEYYGSRTWEQDLEDREKRWEAEERGHDEEELAAVPRTAAAFYKENESEIDAVVYSIEHPDKDIINTLMGLLYDDANPEV